MQQESIKWLGTSLKLSNYPVLATVEKHHSLEKTHLTTPLSTGPKTGHMKRTPKLPTFNSQIHTAGSYRTCFTSYVSTLPEVCATVVFLHPPRRPCTLFSKSCCQHNDSSPFAVFLMPRIQRAKWISVDDRQPPLQLCFINPSELTG